LEHGFFGGPAAGEVLRGLFTGLAVLNLVRCVYPGNEQLAVALDHLRNAKTLDDIGADAKDLTHTLSWPCCFRVLLLALFACRVPMTTVPQAVATIKSTSSGHHTGWLRTRAARCSPKVGRTSVWFAMAAANG